MGKSVAETIRSLSLDHINSGNLLLGQCLTAVGWVGGTIPELPDHKNIIELSMADVAGGAIAVGAALNGSRPIYVVRYQGFLWYNLPTILNYAAKSMDLWRVPCPIIVRAIAMEGKIGPVAGSSHISLAYRMPGINIVSPMTPDEYDICWKVATKLNYPTIISEHRHSYNVDYETPHITYNNPDLTIFTISNTRFEALKFIKRSKLKINFCPIVYIKPLMYKDQMCDMHSHSKYGSLILDDDFEDGVAKSIAYDLMRDTDKKVYIGGLKRRSAGFSPDTDNLPPNEFEIEDAVNRIIGLKNE